MRVLNFGSLNIDHVYAIDHFVRPGETIASHDYQVFAGGKGFNQSLALARGGAAVWHAGKIGQDGLWLKAQLESEGVDVSQITIAPKDPTGHAMIQVNPSGENAIVLHGGANQCVTATEVVTALSSFAAGDYLLLQNEISSISNLISAGAQRGLRVVFNPAPMTPAIRSYPLESIAVFILNETEAAELTGATVPEAIGAAMRQSFPNAITVLTLGRQGAICFQAHDTIYQPAEKVTALDTTGAGDTFIGFFLAQLIQTNDIQQALQMGCRAAALCVTRPGAAASIPRRAEIKIGP